MNKERGFLRDGAEQEASNVFIYPERSQVSLQSLMLINIHQTMHSEANMLM
jgi:hypothetical protein